MNNNIDDFALEIQKMGNDMVLDRMKTVQNAFPDEKLNLFEALAGDKTIYIVKIREDIVDAFQVWTEVKDGKAVVYLQNIPFKPDGLEIGHPQS